MERPSLLDRLETKLNELRGAIVGYSMFLGILFLFGLVCLPFMKAKEKNDKRNISLAWEGVIIPERYGYFGGIFNFDTLEVYRKQFVIRKHGILGGEIVNLPMSQVKKVILGSRLGLKYITIAYEGLIFGDSYQIYTVDGARSDFLIPFLESNGIIIDDNWD